MILQTGTHQNSVTSWTVKVVVPISGQDDGSGEKAELERSVLTTNLVGFRITVETSICA